MKARSASSRRWSGAVVVVAVCALLALSLSVGSAAAEAGKCAPKAEAAGCALPDGARFYKKLSGSGAITVQVGGKGVSLTAYAAPIKCTRYLPMLGSEQELALGISGSQHPKVGKSYVLKKTETQAGEEGEAPAHLLVEATLDFKSAQLAAVKVHMLSEAEGQVACDGNASWNVKRQS